MFMIGNSCKLLSGSINKTTNIFKAKTSYRVVGTYRAVGTNDEAEFTM